MQSIRINKVIKSNQHKNKNENQISKKKDFYDFDFLSLTKPQTIPNLIVVYLFLTIEFE